MSVCGVVVHTQSKTVHAVGECVWAHYLTVTEKADRGGAFSLSAAQQQEVWVQYSALQIALQVWSHLYSLCFCYVTTSASSSAPLLRLIIRV